MANKSYVANLSYVADLVAKSSSAGRSLILVHPGLTGGLLFDRIAVPDPQAIITRGPPLPG
jgi:hypothetical protein